MLVEVLVTGMLVATASIGAAAALISGMVLQDRSERKMGEVASAENLMSRMRILSSDGLNGMATEYHSKAFGGQESNGIAVGEDDTSRQLIVAMAMDETVMPGQIDIDGDGLLTNAAVDPADARLLIVDVKGADKFHLRTAMLDYGRLKNLSPGRTSSGNTSKVAYGETLPPAPPPPEEMPEWEDGWVDVRTVVDGDVSLQSATISGSDTVILLNNAGVEGRKPTAMRIWPNQGDHYFDSVHLDGTSIYTPPAGIDSGGVTIYLDTANELPTGTSTINIGQFFELDGGARTLVDPGKVWVTVFFDDGTAVEIVAE